MLSNQPQPVPENPAPQAPVLHAQPVENDGRYTKAEEDLNRQKACEQLSAEGRKHFNLIEFDPDESIVTEIRKDAVGLFMIFFTGAFVVGISLMAAYFVATVNFESLLDMSGLDAMRGVLMTACLLMVIIALIGTFIGSFLYRSNVIYVTNEKIAQVLYTSLFHRKISQLSIGDVQDVTVAQKGILAHIFRYGTLVVETSGEQQNYTFTFVPDPYVKSKDIVGAHERNLKLYGN